MVIDRRGGRNESGDSTAAGRPATIRPAMDNERLVDKRIVERNLRKGLLKEADYAKYIAALPDVADKGEMVEYGHDTDEDDSDEG